MMPSDPAYDLQGSMRLCQHQQYPHSGVEQHHAHQGSLGLMPHPHPCMSINEVFPLSIGSSHKMADYNKMGEGGKNSPSEEDGQSLIDEGVVDGGQNEVDKGVKASVWHRVKWTDSMVKLMITAVSYIGEDVVSEGRTRRRYLNCQKKGKWKSVSKVMAERGFFVSPQQCEDKFNDLNKRYKKLNDILGRGTSCQVVEKPVLLDMMDHLSDKTKDEVRKILSSKQLFYEEMCSYHNGNRLHLPHDPALQRSLQLALTSRDDDHFRDTEPRRHLHDDGDGDEDDHDAETDDHDEYEDNHAWGRYGDSSKRIKQGQSPEDFCFENPHYLGKGFHAQSQNSNPDMHLALPDGHKAPWLQKQWLKSRELQLEEQKLKIELETAELEKQRLKWLRFSKKKDRELEKLQMENDRMKLENERMALELKRIEMTSNCSQ